MCSNLSIETSLVPTALCGFRIIEKNHGEETDNQELTLVHHGSITFKSAFSKWV